MAIGLRLATESDYAAVNALETALTDSETDRRAAFAAVLADPDHALIVAEAENAVVGLAHLMVYDDLSHGARAGELLGLVVRADRRRQGIGKALLAEAMRVAKQRGVGEFHINTEQDNTTAQRLYSRAGAEVVGVQMEVEL
jgi:ribosomal protein S18 acetylase RimI-like enzyme